MSLSPRRVFPADLMEQWTYWTQVLKRERPTLDALLDYPRPPVQLFIRDKAFSEFDSKLYHKLQVFCTREGANVFTALLTAFVAVLSRYTGQEEIIVGSLSNDSIRQKDDGSQGSFVNPLALLVDLTDDPTARDMLMRVANVITRAALNRDYPFDMLVDDLQQQETYQAAIFQVMFNVLDMPCDFSPTGITAEDMMQVGNCVAACDMAITFAVENEILQISCEYDSELFDAAKITRLLGGLKTLLEQMIDAPLTRLSCFSLLTTEEYRQLVVDWCTTQANIPSAGFQELFAAQVDLTPDAIAVVYEQEQYTYEILNQRANRVASRLHEAGVGPEVLVALLGERDISLLVAILAVLKASGAYFALDPTDPPARLSQLLKQSQSLLVIFQEACTPLLSQVFDDSALDTRIQRLSLEQLEGDGQFVELPPVHYEGKQLAYVFYTSGSTGVPKGAMIEQAGMLNHLYAKIRVLHLTAADVIAQTGSQCFDISVWQFLAPLLVGGKTHIFKDNVTHDPVLLLKRLEQVGATIFETIPSLLQLMLGAVEEQMMVVPPLKELRWIIPTGEALPPELCRWWLAHYPHAPLLNAYGATECSDDVTHYAIHEDPPFTVIHMPVGRPIENMQQYVLDEHLQPIPIGVRGEVYFGGLGVGRGYLGDPQRTAEVFLPNPFDSLNGSRLYKTGDLAYYLPDGSIAFLGRIDHQVKVGGHRIETGEIEARLREHPALHEVVVIVRQDEFRERYLAAYIVAREQPAPATLISELRSHLQRNLPSYMIPSVFVLLDKMPLNTNGKANRHALPAPDMARNGLNEAYVGPRTPIEANLAALWAEALDVKQVGIFDNFFELGAHSLIAMQVIAQIRAQMHADVPLRSLYEAPTIATLAQRIEQTELEKMTGRDN